MNVKLITVKRIEINKTIDSITDKTVPSQKLLFNLILLEIMIIY
jgi:hypothetical protein